VLLRRTFWKAWAAWELRRGVPAKEGLTP
jgi:hypothetical protein